MILKIRIFERLNLKGQIVEFYYLRKKIYIIIFYAYLVELVDTSDLKSDSFQRVSVQVR